MTITVRILIAEDRRLVHQGLRMFLTLDPEIEVVGKEESHGPPTTLAGQSLVVHTSRNSLDGSPRSGGDAFAVHAHREGGWHGRRDRACGVDLGTRSTGLARCHGRPGARAGCRRQVQ